MAINLLKRMESSVCAFKITIYKIKKLIEDFINKIDAYENFSKKSEITVTDVCDSDDFDFDDQNGDEFNVIGKKVQINLADMDRKS